VTLASILVAIGLRLYSADANELTAELPTLQSSAAVLALTDSAPRIKIDEVTGAEVTFYNVNTRETESFFFRFDGVISKQDETRLKHLFRCKRSGREKKPDRGLLQILARLGERYPGRTFELVSAHRATGSPSIKTSKHYSGHAVDFRIRGVDITEVRTFLWQSLRMPIGLGHYRRDGFLHVDFRPEEGSIAWDVRRRGRENYHYNPRWSRLLN